MASLGKDEVGDGSKGSAQDERGDDYKRRGDNPQR